MRDVHQIAGTVLVADVLGALSQRRPVFHSEADFQHELAWQIRMADPSLAVRLEIPLVLDAATGRREWLDLRVTSREGTRTAIELKYVTDRLETTVEGERFNLARRAAQDITTYDIVKDVARLERFVTAGEADDALLILLANDAWYWKTPTNDRAIGSGQFRVHEGTLLTGVRTWQAGSGPGTRKGREAPIGLWSQYRCHWVDYPTVPAGPFRMLVLGVASS